MKLNEAIEMGKTGCWRDAQVRLTPGSRSKWFVMLHDTRYKTYVLADDEDRPIADEDLNTLSRLIQTIGLKEFTVCL
ncbi:hypothetical protein [Kineobactrum salinum]|uniref:Transposase n=1 Tax=Kineobactrum salinum TaxID=2708301 RepID=A0A6C0U4E5_9GAMM|nr:hypothetical protein [Kineobactrum salinum]QIB66886.1 hypothetical protein G3T16_17310 [Kineobactrum salinum]